MTPLLQRLREELADVAIDVLVSRPCAPVTALLPGVRNVYCDDVHAQLGHVSAGTDTTRLIQEVVHWADPFRKVGYDRVINITFTRRSGLLASAIAAPDTRGVLLNCVGAPLVQNPWFVYFADLLQYRRFNRFNLVDLFTLGGSGHGTYTPIRLAISMAAEKWARAEFPSRTNGVARIAVQVGASRPEKAWRAESFGRTMAAISRRTSVEFILTGTVGEKNTAQQALRVYKTAGGKGPIFDSTGRTDIEQLAALLQSCDLLITNDTGTMHVAIGVGVRVLNISVGPVSFWETGPYGENHWVIRADSVESEVGNHDSIVPEQVAELAVHLLGRAPLPSSWTGVQVYESRLDADGLNQYRQRAGQCDERAQWYGTFWRKYWYEQFERRPSRIALDEPCPDLNEQQDVFSAISPIADQLVAHANDLVDLNQRDVSLSALQPAAKQLADMHSRLMKIATPSSAFAPLTIALLRDLHNGDGTTAKQLARQHLFAYRTFRDRARSVIERLTDVCAEASFWKEKGVRNHSLTCVADGAPR
ncbi:MAG TPA: glycosyltransferase family 9 protein [Nitrospira sp.]|nr:glycosyltransferase family 9 protein [Nitrospira sp.]